MQIIVIILLSLLGLRIFAADADSVNWQLTFTYDAGGLSLIKSAEIPPTHKRIVTPNLAGAVLKLDYDLVWEDGAGQVIASSQVVVPLGTRAALSEQDGRHTTVIRDAGAFVLRVAGPDPALRPVRIRLLKRGNAEAAGIRAAADAENPGAFAADEHAFDLALPMVRGMAAAAAPEVAGPLSVLKIRETGPDNNRLVIVVMCDGFTEAELVSGSFSNTVRRFFGNFFNTPPWNNYANGVNVYRVDIASNESGADYEDAAPGSGGTTKDTFLNAAFWVGNTERCLYLTGNGEARAFAAADSLVGAGVWDEVLVFVNSTKYGGCGGSVGVSSLHSSTDQIQIHEFGHSFAGLADEYDYGSSGTNCTPSSARNIECPWNFPSVKWNAWVTPGTPIPTPDISQYDNAVGAFEGAAYQTIGIFRPMRNCKMRSLGAPFCPICSETHIIRLLDRVALADGVSPPAGPAEVPRTGTAQFSVTSLSIANLTYRWELGGNQIPGAGGPSILLNGSQVTQPNQELKVTVINQTPLVRAVVLQDSFRWTLTLVDSPSVSVDDVTFAEPVIGPASAVFHVTLSFAIGEEAAVDYYTGFGTATPGLDYMARTGTLRIPPGQRTNAVTVPFYPDDLAEPTEFFFLNLANPINARLGDSQGTGAILDDDHPPSITITNPPPLTVFSEPASIGVQGVAADADGSVTNVALFVGTTFIAETNTAGFAFVWTDAAEGLYTLQAVASDNSGRRATSAPVKVVVSRPVPPPIRLVQLDSLWKFDATTNDYGPAWKNVSYVDDLWDGPAPGLFYNETAALPGPMNTFLPLTYNSARIRSYYFRTRFDFSPAPGGITLVSSNIVDDGAVFWLNGLELGRLRMSGAPNRTSLATAQPPGSDATALETLVFPAGSLLQGENLLAVEVHQQNDNSSDMAFGMELDAVFGYAPFIIDDTLPADRTVTQGQPLTVTVQAVGSPIPRYQWYRNGSPILNATNPTYSVAAATSAAEGNYFCRVTNQLGAVESRAANIDYLQDLEAPGVAYAYGHSNLTSITVTFSEGMLAAEAGRATNYTISPFITVLTAVQTSASNVVLTTSPRTRNVNYLLSISDVRDRFSNSIPASTQIPIAAEVTLVGGDRQPWHYFQSDRAPEPGWLAPGYQPTAPWALGQALFDAKRPARATLPPNNEPVRTQLNLTNPPTAGEVSAAYYFRAQFRFPGPPAGARLFLRALVDDGAVFYLNGREVLRLGMPAFPASVNYNTYATRTQGDTQTIYEGPFPIPSEALVEGDNVLAAEVHQVNLASSDASFAAQLIGRVPYVRPFDLIVQREVGQIVLRWTDHTAMLQVADQISGPWNDVLPPPGSPYNAGSAVTMRFYRLRGP